MGSCSVDKYLQPGQKVLYRNEVNVVMADSSKVKPEVSEALSNVRQFYYQTPNKRFLFMPLRMRLYCSTNPDDSSGWSNFWRNQGEAPEVYDPLAAAVKVKPPWCTTPWLLNARRHRLPPCSRPKGASTPPSLSTP